MEYHINMKKIALYIFIIILLNSCVTGQNLKRGEVEKGIIPHSYVESMDHFFAIILDIEDTEKWKIFYEDNQNLYYGNLINKNTIENLFHIDKTYLEKTIPLYRNANIRTIITDNIMNHIKDSFLFSDRVEDTLEIKYAGVIEKDEIIKYQFEATGYHKPAVCFFGNGRYKLNVVVLTDQNFNILESYYLHKFK
jgi:hypothetical protein